MNIVRAKTKLIFIWTLQPRPRGSEDLQGQPDDGRDSGEDEAHRLRVLPSGRDRPQPRKLRLRRNHPHQDHPGRVSTQTRAQPRSPGSLVSVHF